MIHEDSAATALHYKCHSSSTMLPSPTSYGASNILKKKLPLDVGGGEQSML